jgi:hypothetical protein
LSPQTINGGFESDRTSSSLTTYENVYIVKYLNILLMKGKRKTVTISLETWRRLLNLKGELNARSLDKVLEELIKTWERQKQSS